jgi:hypothetical protein
MPCNCRVKEPSIPMNEEWGPVMWRVLHGLAEKSGNVNDPVHKIEEVNVWPRLIKVLTQGLPCDECRDHFNIWLKANPFKLPTNYIQTKEYIKKWLFDLHNNVNERNGKSLFNYTELNDVYSNVPLKLTIDMLNKIVDKSVKAGVVRLLSWSSTIKYMQNLLFIYN